MLSNPNHAPLHAICDQFTATNGLQGRIVHYVYRITGMQVDSFGTVGLSPFCRMGAVSIGATPVVGDAFFLPNRGSNGRGLKMRPRDPEPTHGYMWRALV